MLDCAEQVQIQKYKTYTCISLAARACGLRAPRRSMMMTTTENDDDEASDGDDENDKN